MSEAEKRKSIESEMAGAAADNGYGHQEGATTGTVTKRFHTLSATSTTVANSIAAEKAVAVLSENSSRSDLQVIDWIEMVLRKHKPPCLEGSALGLAYNDEFSTPLKSALLRECKTDIKVHNYCRQFPDRINVIANTLNVTTNYSYSLV